MFHKFFYGIGATVITLGGFASVVEIVNNICKWRLERRMEKKLIKWSNDGNDFLGPVNSQEGYQHLSGKSFQSPKGNMQIEIGPSGCLRLKSSDMDKYLHPDGNTYQCTLFFPGNSEKPWMKRWTLEGDELVESSRAPSGEPNLC